MAFTTTPFIPFVLLLLPLYWLAPQKARRPVLLCASVLYYACAGWRALCCAACVVLSVYLCALRIDQLQRRQKDYLREHREAFSREQRKLYNKQQKRRQTTVLALCIGANFALLFFIKLPLQSVLVPLGVSFYMFRCAGYLIDVYWRKIPAEKNPAKLALFALFFPAIPQGPIGRYEFAQENLLADHSFDAALFQSACARVALGYFKKLVVADRLFLAMPETQAPWLTVFIYTAALFCDFSGGIDIALGVGGLFGVRLEENFRAPFLSRDIFEYWRRWHITMGGWFRDYVFYPLSVAPVFKKLPPKAKVYSATLLTWFFTGLWHGLAWHYIIWGLVNGLIIILSTECKPLYAKFHARFPKLETSKFYTVFRILRTFTLMAFVRAIDILSPGQWLALFKAPVLGISAADWLVALTGLAILLFAFARRQKPKALLTALAVLAILIFGLYGLGYDASSFVYTKF